MKYVLNDLVRICIIITEKYFCYIDYLLHEEVLSIVYDEL